MFSSPYFDASYDDALFSRLRLRFSPLLMPWRDAIIAASSMSCRLVD